MDHPPPPPSSVGYLWLLGMYVFAISMLGGVAGFIRRHLEGKTPVVSLFALVGELCIAGFVGLLTFGVCIWAGLLSLTGNFGTEAAIRSAAITAVLVGVTSHMGTRALALFEQTIVQRIERGMHRLFGDGAPAKDEPPS